MGPRLVILLEEVNATMTQLKRYWAKTRESGDPKESPAVDALAEILFMGRQVRLHVLLVAQSATARAIGGPEMRENFSTRILVRYTLNAWRMLVPEVSPIPDHLLDELRVRDAGLAGLHAGEDGVRQCLFGLVPAQKAAYGFAERDPVLGAHCIHDGGGAGSREGGEGRGAFF
ncbi:hypothetical protein [Streptomyces phaeochromogenes]|uniref:hypothetical protein n=1 Tax=Streptomyces phaeochromogenes TaxID=1923 RepID=UPI00367D03D0